MSNELQKEGGLVPHRDQLFEAELNQNAKDILGRMHTADSLEALANLIRNGNVKGNEEISDAIKKLAETASYGSFYPRDKTPLEESSED